MPHPGGGAKGGGESGGLGGGDGDGMRDVAKLSLWYTSYCPVGALKLVTEAIDVPPEQSGDEFGF